MIKVKFVYVDKTSRYKNADTFVYMSCEINGHSQHTGDALDYIRVCSAISGITNGIYRLVNDAMYEIEYGNGHFLIKKRHHNPNNYDRDTNDAINTMLCQLYEIYIHFPKHFAEFEIEEIKGEEKNNETRSNAKQRKERREEMGVCAD